MANITEPQVSGSRSRSTARLKRHSARTDMTPMVDLGFLLIAFFVMTTEMSRPSVTKLYMPKDQGPHSTLAESNALTLLIGGDKIYYYHGDWEKARTANGIQETNFSIKNGIGKLIREKQARMDLAGVGTEGRNGLMFIVKPAPEANYQQVIDAIDETQINGVKKWVIVSPAREELHAMQQGN